MERAKEREEAWSFDGPSEGKRTAAKDSEENKENLLVSSELKDDLLLYQDEEELNASVVSGERAPGAWRGARALCAVPGSGREFGGPWGSSPRPALMREPPALRLVCPARSSLRGPLPRSPRFP